MVYRVYRETKLIQIRVARHRVQFRVKFWSGLRLFLINWACNYVRISACVGNVGVENLILRFTGVSHIISEHIETFFFFTSNASFYFAFVGLIGVVYERMIRHLANSDSVYENLYISESWSEKFNL